MTHSKIFNLDYDASYAEVKANYRAMARIYHPDQHNSERTGLVKPFKSRTAVQTHHQCTWISTDQARLNKNNPLDFSTHAEEMPHAVQHSHSQSQSGFVGQSIPKLPCEGLKREFNTTGHVIVTEHHTLQDVWLELLAWADRWNPDPFKKSWVSEWNSKAHGPLKS